MITIVALGCGAPEAVPTGAIEALRGRGAVFGDLDPPLAAAVEPEVSPLPEPPPADAVVVAPDPQAHRLAARFPEARTVPERPALRARAIGCEVAALAEVGAHLRQECPWDRAQTAETIVPHTIEEAFEVAEAVAEGEPEALADELGDLLFQAVFLAQLQEERGHADLGTIARGQLTKLVSRHPHVYGDAEAVVPIHGRVST